MIWLFLTLLALLVLVLQRNSAQQALDRLTYTASCDALLVEPDQAITLQAVIENRSRLPVMYLRLVSDLPANARLLEDDVWQQDHVRVRPQAVCVEQSAYLLPRRRRVCRFHFSLPDRGWYPLGSAVVFTGDFLGFREKHRAEEACAEVVVIPRLVQTPEVLRTLGGFLGDVSVRRFILEDPVLTVGARDYTGREPMKAISWPQSVRAGRLMVKEYDHTADWNVTVLLNTQGGSRAQLEQCYRLTRTVCEFLEKKGVPYAFSTNGDLMGPMGMLSGMAEGLGRQHLQTILYGLGRARCRCRFSWKKLAEQALHTGRMGRSHILITPPLTAEGQAAADRLRQLGGLCILTGEEAEP